MKITRIEKSITIFEKRETVTFSLLTQFEVPEDSYTSYIESAASRYELELLLNHQFVRVVSHYTSDQKLVFRCKLLNKIGVRQKYIIYKDCENYISVGGLFLSSIIVPQKKWESFIIQYPKTFFEDLASLTIQSKDSDITILHRKRIVDIPTEPQIRCMLLLLNYLYPLGDLTEDTFTIASTDSAFLTGTKKKQAP